VKSTYILQPSPAALTEGVHQIHEILGDIHAFDTKDTKNTKVRLV
jgi:hypothetical protein